MSSDPEKPPVTGPLDVERLCWRCDPGLFGFETTEELEDLGEVIGQERALEAIRFAAGMARPGYNLFALGPEGSGRHTVVRHFLDRAARERAVPDDWCYLSNFKAPRAPLALRLAAGRGRGFRSDMARFVDDLREALRAAFESDEHRTRRQVIEDELKERQEQALAEVEGEAKARGIALLRTPMGFAFAPVSDGTVVTPEVFQQFPKAEQQRIGQEIEALQKRLQQALQQSPLWMTETRDKLRQLNTETATFAVGHLIEAVRGRYQDVPEILDYLEEVKADVVENVEAIVAAPERAVAAGPGQGGGPGGAPGGGLAGAPAGLGAQSDLEDGHPLKRRYRVNLIIDNSALAHGPVVYDDDPTYDRLVGRIEHRAEMGALLTDFHMIRPGSVHRANGGYLILDAQKLLTRPMAWDALKRVLRAEEIRIQPPGQAMGLFGTTTLEPEPIPLDVKVVLIGDRRLYYLLSGLDPDFPRLFKVAADFEERIERSEDNSRLYARLIATLARRESLRPLDRGAVARALQYSARLAGDAERLSTSLESVADLLREADYWAGQEGRARITEADVERTIEAQIDRLDRVRDQVQEQMVRGTVAIATEGAAAGQVNGLSVLQLGGFAFGRPSRITARIRLGRGEVIDIEREVELGGPLHSKGVLILSGYLSAHYASERPLSLSASLVFEQSYGGIDGDSASSAELYALLSAIAEVPIKQGFAVTGSVNQFGEVQAIGGVNEKIEGFFDLCAARGLTGEQGVLIPATNVKHLMLDRRVREAVAEGRFSVHAIATIDQGIALLTGLPAGERGPDGRFPEGSVNARVEARLLALAEARRSFAAPQRGSEP